MMLTLSALVNLPDEYLLINLFMPSRIYLKAIINTVSKRQLLKCMFSIKTVRYQI